MHICIVLHDLAGPQHAWKASCRTLPGVCPLTWAYPFAQNLSARGVCNLRCTFQLPSKLQMAPHQVLAAQDEHSGIGAPTDWDIFSRDLNQEGTSAAPANTSLTQHSRPEHDPAMDDLLQMFLKDSKSDSASVGASHICPSVVCSCIS